MHQTIQVEMDFIAVIQPQIAMYSYLSWMILESEYERPLKKCALISVICIFKWLPEL